MHYRMHGAEAKPCFMCWVSNLRCDRAATLILVAKMKRREGEELYWSISLKKKKRKKVLDVPERWKEMTVYSCWACQNWKGMSISIVLF